MSQSLWMMCLLLFAEGGTVSQILWWQEATAVKLRHAIAFGHEARDPDGIDLTYDATERRGKSPPKDGSHVGIARANDVFR